LPEIFGEKRLPESLYESLRPASEISAFGRIGAAT
jgi:hypothetical protein